jgi:hypothetical protein
VKAYKADLKGKAASLPAAAAEALAAAQADADARVHAFQEEVKSPDTSTIGTIEKNEASGSSRGRILDSLL